MKGFVQIIVNLVFVLISIHTMAQKNTFNYTARWKKVDSLASKGLPKSALAETKIIYTQAKKDGNEAQQLKAALFMISFEENSRENAGPAGIADLEKEISSPKLSVAAKAILYSTTAQAYWQYYQSIRWKLYDRSNVNSSQSADIDNWSAEDFHARISELFLASLEDEKLLISTSLQKFEPLIIKGNARELRPTLFDLLAARALTYFQNEERSLTKPAYAFELDNPLVFSKTDVFAKTRFTTADSSSLYFKALHIYQQLLGLHLNDTKPAALIDADLNRLQFVYEHSTLSDKAKRYREALQELANRHPNDPASAQALFLIAAQFNQSADNYKPGSDSTHRYDRVKAREICEAVLKKFSAIPFDQSEGKVNCYNLLQEILKPEISFEVEKVNLPGKAYRILVSYRNTNAIWLRVLKADKDEKLNEYEDQFWNQLVKQTALEQWKQPLPETRDLQTHRVEIPAKALTAGTYRLLVSSDDRFLPKKSFMSTRKFYSSTISYINAGADYFVLNRETGQPLSNAKATVYKFNYDYNNRSNTFEKGETYTTDAQGHFSKPANESGIGSNNYRLSVSWNGETLFIEDGQYDYRSYGPDAGVDEKVQIFFFLDRSIYRPGQIVYFKGIAVKSQGMNKNQVAADWNTTIMLKDVNGQLLDSLPVTSNSYGSFSGKFTLPASGLTGQFLINDNRSSSTRYFSVEEYKRPSFRVNYDTLKSTYALNDSVHMTGAAKAYAGNAIANAQLSYRVVRQTRYLYPWLYRRWYLPPTPAQEIAHGVIETDAEGNFDFSFLLQPDKSVDPKLQPTFDYQVTVNVTDLNGETRSADQTITAAYQSLYLKATIPATLESDSLNSFFVRTENLNGSFHPTTVRVSISKLKPENRLIRERYWEEPDLHILSREEYINLFPHDEYADESNPATWAVESVVLEKTDTTVESGLFRLFEKNDGRKLPPGYYKIELLTNDSEGKPVKDLRYLQLTNASEKSLPSPAYLFTRGTRPIEPGHSTDILLGTSAEDVFLIQQLNKTGYVEPDFRFSGMGNTIRKFVWGATEEDRGGYGVTYLFVKDNRFFQFRDIIQVPWTNKELKIEYGTFRNKLLPGSEEKWTLKISGEKGDAVSAELLASMYDASLDQFKPHEWSVPGIWQDFAFAGGWMSTPNFSAITGNMHWIASDNKAYEKRYDRLIQPNDIQETVTLRYSMKAGSPRMSAPAAMADQQLNGEMQESKAQEVASMDTVANAAPNPAPEIQVRRNLHETAFFFPDLQSDSSGNISFSFTMPEALTEWKFQAFAHTNQLSQGLSSNTVITQKELMVQPNMPRFCAKVIALKSVPGSLTSATAK